MIRIEACKRPIRFGSDADRHWIRAFLATRKERKLYHRGLARPVAATKLPTASLGGRASVTVRRKSYRRGAEPAEAIAYPRGPLRRQNTAPLRSLRLCGMTYSVPSAYFSCWHRRLLSHLMAARNESTQKPARLAHGEIFAIGEDF